MVENGTGGTSQHKQREQKQPPLANRNVGTVNGFEIARGCLLYINQLSADVLLQDNAAFLCRIVILHKRHLTEALRSNLADLSGAGASIIVFSYHGKHEKYSDSTFVGVDMQLNWLSGQINQNNVPEGSLLAEVLSGKSLVHVDSQAIFSQIDIADLLDQVDDKPPIAYLLLNHYFYGIIAACFSRLLLDKSYFVRGDLAPPNEAKQLHKALTFINQSLQRKFPGVRELAFICGMSVTSFIEKFHTAFRETPFQYFTRKQMEVAVDQLQGIPIKSISYNLGYQDPANFSRAFKKFYGKSPKQFDL